MMLYENNPRWGGVYGPLPSQKLVVSLIPQLAARDYSFETSLFKPFIFNVLDHPNNKLACQELSLLLRNSH